MGSRDLDEHVADNFVTADPEPGSPFYGMRPYGDCGQLGQPGPGLAGALDRLGDGGKSAQQ